MAEKELDKEGIKAFLEDWLDKYEDDMVYDTVDEIREMIASLSNPEYPHE